MRKAKKIIVLCLLIIIGILQISNVVGATTTVVFHPTDDTMIKNEAPFTPYGNLWNIAVRNVYGESNKNFYEIDTLINFDISSIPSKATILSASLNLYYYNWSGTNPAGRNLTIYLIRSSWSEQYVYWNTQPSYATTPSSSSFVPQSKGQWMSWDVTDDVQYLVQERAYYGWKIADEVNWEKSNVPMTYFWAQEYGNYIPFLEVTYSVSEADTGPIAVFSIAPLNPSTEDSIQFTDTSYDSEGTITEWFWNFGDGNSSTERNPTHTYAKSGQYIVTLRVTDNKGLTDSLTTVFLISAPKSTPGFELIIMIGAIAMAFLWMRKSKK